EPHPHASTTPHGIALSCPHRQSRPPGSTLGTSLHRVNPSTAGASFAACILFRGSCRHRDAGAVRCSVNAGYLAAPHGLTRDIVRALTAQAKPIADQELVRRREPFPGAGRGGVLVARNSLWGAFKGA